MAVKKYNTKMIEKIKKNLDYFRNEANIFFGNKTSGYQGIQRHEEKDIPLEFMLYMFAKMQTEIDEIKKPKEFKSNGYKPKRLPCMKKKDN